MTEQKRLRAETNRCIQDARDLADPRCGADFDSAEDALAAERAHAEARLETARKELRDALRMGREADRLIREERPLMARAMLSNFDNAIRDALDALREEAPDARD